MKFLLQMKMTSLAAIVVLFSLIAAGCDTGKKEAPFWTLPIFGGASDSKNITAFSLNGATGVISGLNINVTVPYGTDVADLVATFSTTGASVDIGFIFQECGITPNDFTTPVTYCVTAADNSSQDYTVTVTIALNSAKNITAFSFPSAPATGVIDGLNISVTVPYGTDVADLVATFSSTGTSVQVGAITQVSAGTSNDFTGDVTYRVTAADSTYQDYTVSVAIALNTAKNITAFGFPSAPATGVISGTNISVTVPYGTSVTALVATFSTTGASVEVGVTSQESSVTANDFTEPVTYRVTAADSSYQDYTVTVTIALNPAKNITAFSFPSAPATGVISGLNISVTVPYGTSVTALVATFSTTGASVQVGETTQISAGTPNNFTSPVMYRVTAADSSYQDYTVTVTIALNPAKNITAFSFPSAPATGVISGLNISVTVPYGTSVTALVATFSTTGASVQVGETTQVSAGTPNNFTSPVMYRVTAADSSYQDYTVTVTIALNPAKNITAYSFPSAPATGVISGLNISVTVPYGTSVTALVATFSTTGASVKVGETTQVSAGTPNNFTSPVTYRVTAADSSYQDYIVTVTVSAQTCSSTPCIYNAGTSTGNMGGKSGADSICNNSSNKPAGTTGYAFMSFDSSNQIVNLPTTAGLNPGSALYGPNGQKLANNLADLLDYSLCVGCVNFQTAGVVPVNAYYWNFSNGDGTIYGSDHCSNGTSSSSGLNGMTGRGNMSYPGQAAWHSCNTIDYVVCIAVPID